MLTRDEKRSIRQQISSALKECSSCEYKSKNVPSDGICYTSCKTGAKLQTLGNLLENKESPAQVTGKWTNEEKLYLFNHYGLYDMDHLCERLNRSEESVANQIRHMLSNKQKYIKSYA